MVRGDGWLVVVCQRLSVVNVVVGAWLVVMGCGDGGEWWVRGGGGGGGGGGDGGCDNLRPHFTRKRNGACTLVQHLLY
jgi:hypothetical protein